MIPAAITGEVVDQLAELMEPGDVIIDGGNSYYRDDIARASKLRRPGSTTSTAAPAAACSVSNAASA